MTPWLRGLAVLPIDLVQFPAPIGWLTWSVTPVPEDTAPSSDS